MSGPATNGDPALGRWCDRVLERERQVVEIEIAMMRARLAGDGAELADLRQRLSLALTRLEAAKAELLAEETAHIEVDLTAAPRRGGRSRSWR